MWTQAFLRINQFVVISNCKNYQRKINLEKLWKLNLKKLQQNMWMWKSFLRNTSMIFTHVKKVYYISFIIPLYINVFIEREK